MSFGFSISDFFTLGGLALKLYNEFRVAPGACRAFANELLLFHQLLDKMGYLREEIELLGASDRAALKTCADSCKELIYVQIYGAACGRTVLQIPGTMPRTSSESISLILRRGPDGEDRFFRAWRQKWGERKFAARIPELQRAVTAHIQSLTAFYTLIIRSEQLRVFACQDRLETLQEQTQEYLEDTHKSMKKSQIRLEAASERIERSHEIMERQLQGILASQQRQENPILSQSLDASSPEGRETWMNLGRLLRAEGITPAKIKQNPEILVKAMKTTLQDDEPSDTPQSYYTAYESLPNRHPTFTNLSSSRSFVQASVSLLGSAPPRSSIFTNEFLERHNGRARSLDQDANVKDGLQSLLQGMDDYGLHDGPEDVNEYNENELEGLNKVHEMTDGFHDDKAPEQWREGLNEVHEMTDEFHNDRTPGQWREVPDGLYRDQRFWKRVGNGTLGIGRVEQWSTV